MRVSSSKSRKRSASSMDDDERRRLRSAARKRQRKAKAAREASKKKRIPLGLSEWKQRQQWKPTPPSEAKDASGDEMSQEGALSLPTKLDDVEMTDLPLWESVNPIPYVKQQPVEADPPRSRHSDEKYAEWIDAMVNILSGSGRSWALHEFFYSDIDRAWYVFMDRTDVVVVSSAFNTD